MIGADDDGNDIGESKAKPVPKEPPVDPPTTDEKCDQKQNPKSTTTVTGVVFSGLFSSLLLPPVHSSLCFPLNIHGDRNNIDASCSSTLCFFVLFETFCHSTSPGKRL
jgi:hypothetical protein